MLYIMNISLLKMLYSVKCDEILIFYILILQSFTFVQ